DVIWFVLFFFFSSRRRHTRLQGDWSSDVCSSDLGPLSDVTFIPLPTRKGTIAGLMSLTLPPGVRVGQVYKFTVEQYSGQTLKTRSEERRVGKECRSRWWG